MNQGDVNSLAEGMTYPLEEVLYGCTAVKLDDEDVYFDDRFEHIDNYGSPTISSIESQSGVMDTLMNLPLFD